MNDARKICGVQEAAAAKARVGDRIRITRVPRSVMDMPAATRDGEEGTRTAFTDVIGTKRSYRVAELHPTLRRPMLNFIARTASGKRISHTLEVDEGCYEVAPRRGGSSAVEIRKSSGLLRKCPPSRGRGCV